MNNSGFKSLSRWIALPALLSVMVFFVGCDQQSTSPADTETTAETQTYTGKQIFKGVLFGQGEVASELPELWGQKVDGSALEKSHPELADEYTTYEGLANSPRATKASSQIVGWIEENRPEFFAEFGAAMQSGDQVKVRDALRDARTVIKDGAEALTDGNVVLDGEVKNLAELRKEAQSKDVNVTVETSVAVAVAAVLVLLVTQIDITPAPGGGDTELAYDTMVDDLTTRLEAPSQPILTESSS